MSQVGWDGTAIWNRPFKVLVNSTHDRYTVVRERNVFHKLYPKKYFQEWRVFQMFELVELRSSA